MGSSSAGSESAVSAGPGSKGGSAVASATQPAAGGAKGGDIDKILQTLPSAGEASGAALKGADEAEQEMAMLKSASRSGLTKRANDLAAKLDGLVKQAKTSSMSASMLALAYRSKQLTSDASTAAAVLDAALAAAAKAPDLPARIAAFQSVGELAGQGATAGVEKALLALEETLRLEKGNARQVAAAAMSAAYASLGDEGKAQSARRLIANATGASPADTHTTSALALVSSDIALARHLHSSGLNGQAETVLARIAGYLFT